MLYRHRKQWSRTKGGHDNVHVYEVIDDLQKIDNKKRLKTKIVSNSPESEASTLTARPNIDEIHDRSENQNNTTIKSLVKNILYETG